MLTTHARQRIVIDGRTGLMPEEVRNILDQGLDIPIGEDRSRGVTHRLFYSKAEDECFVAFQSVDGMVITVWPARWHHRKREWAISQHAKRLAKQVLLTGKPWQVPPSDQPVSSESAGGAKRRRCDQKPFWHIAALVRHIKNGTEQYVMLGKYQPIISDASLLAKEERFGNLVRGWLRTNSRIEGLLTIEATYTVEAIAVRQGRQEWWQVVPVEF